MTHPHLMQHLSGLAQHGFAHEAPERGRRHECWLHFLVQLHTSTAAVVWHRGHRPLPTAHLQHACFGQAELHCACSPILHKRKDTIQRAVLVVSLGLKMLGSCLAPAFIGKASLQTLPHLYDVHTGANGFEEHLGCLLNLNSLPVSVILPYLAKCALLHPKRFILSQAFLVGWEYVRCAPMPQKTKIQGHMWKIPQEFINTNIF